MRTRLGTDDGFTLAEVAVYIGLFSLLSIVIVSVMMSSSDNFEREITRTTSNDEIRLAVQSLDREVRSGQVVYDPSQEVYAAADITAGMSLRVYSQANVPTRGEALCVQWRITSDGELQRREWKPDWSSISDWRVVATGLRNRDESIAAFTRPQPNMVNVRLRANDDPTGAKGATVEVQQSVSGRNTLFNSIQSVCGPPSPAPSASAPGVPAY
jgi:type II secretory pathway pseudopilin PulG